MGLDLGEVQGEQFVEFDPLFGTGDEDVLRAIQFRVPDFPERRLGSASEWPEIAGSNDSTNRKRR